MKQKIILIIVLILLAFISINIGAESLDFTEVNSQGTLSNILFYKSRLPRTLSLIITGFGISLAGLIFQHISRNKFVSPTTSGTVSGAQLGIAISMVLLPGTSTINMMLIAFVTSLISTFIFMFILSKLKFKDIIIVPLLGVMIGAVIRGFTTLLAYKFNFLQVLEGWFYGSFSLVIAGRFEMLYLAVPPIILAFIYAKAFSIAGFGKDFSTNLGLNYNQVIVIGLIIISIINATTVLVVGSIPFLGLIIPNICSLYLGDNLKNNILTVGLSGANFLVLCDIFSRTINRPYEIPVGLVAGVIGCVAFLYLIFRKGGEN